MKLVRPLLNYKESARDPESIYIRKGWTAGPFFFGSSIRLKRDELQRIAEWERKGEFEETKETKA